jgi:hypothetical protein
MTRKICRTRIPASLSARTLSRQDVRRYGDGIEKTVEVGAVDDTKGDNG